MEARGSDDVCCHSWLQNGGRPAWAIGDLALKKKIQGKENRDGSREGRKGGREKGRKGGKEERRKEEMEGGRKGRKGTMGN